MSSHLIEKEIQNHLTKNKKKPTLIIGIVVGIVALIAIISIVVFLLVFRKNKKQNNAPASENQSNDIPVSMVTSIQNFVNPLYDNDINDSRDPFN